MLINTLFISPKLGQPTFLEAEKMQPKQTLLNSMKNVVKLR